MTNVGDINTRCSHQQAADDLHVVASDLLVNVSGEGQPGETRGRFFSLFSPLLFGLL